MSDLSSRHMHMLDKPPPSIGETTRRKQLPQQPRQLLSCTKCRERKVKCDRTKPCSACCARGAPKECHFIAEGGDYAPIQQSYELRKLRTENLRLKERLRAYKVPIEEDDSDPAASPESQVGERPTSSQKRRVAKQKRFQGSEWQDSIYFGSPGLASVVHDFASNNMDPLVNLAHIIPRGPDMYTPRNPPTHPFATLFKATPEECIPQLLSCLPSRAELLECLGIFENRVSVCSFPHVPVEVTRGEVERFLSDARKNAQMCPDMLALLFAAVALGVQYSIWSKAGGKWDSKVMSDEMAKGNVYIAAAMQALRLASFMHKPSLLAIQVLIMIGPYLTNSGRFLDAWTLFGTTIRLAHSIGLHRHPKYLDPSPPTQKECSIRQTLWWWMLHMDEQYSMTLGRPLGISGFGDCPWPHELTTDATTLRFAEFVNHFTILARHILSNDRSTNAKIDDLTDSLRALWDTMPETLQFDETWIKNETENVDWRLRIGATIYYCKLHTYVTLLNRQRVEKTPVPAHLPIAKSAILPFRPVNQYSPSQPSPAPSMQPPLRGRAAVLASSEDMLSAFMFVYYKEPAMLIDWTMGQQAFNSCMILLLDAIELERITMGVLKVEQAFVVFKELEDNKVHKLATLAVERISWGLTEVHRIVSQAAMIVKEHEQEHASTPPGQQGPIQGYGSSDTVMGNTGMMLLEDPGLQSFVHEAFVPIRWTTREPETVPIKEQKHHTSHGARQMGNLSSEMTRHNYRSVVEMQGTRESPTTRSAPTRYATPSDDDSRPRGYTIPISPTSSAIPHRNGPGAPLVVQHESQSFQRHQHWSAPHLLQAQERTTATQLSRNAAEQEDADLHAHDRIQQCQDARIPSADPHQAPFAQSRHTSCPSFPQMSGGAPLLRPTNSSPGNITSDATGSPAMQTLRNAQLEAHIAASGAAEQASLDAFLDIAPHPNPTLGNPRNYASFAARSAAPMTSIPDATSGFSSTSDHDHMPLEQQQQQQRRRRRQNQHQHQHRHPQARGHSFPVHFSSATPSTMTHPGEELRLEEWRGYIGSSGPG